MTTTSAVSDSSNPYASLGLAVQQSSTDGSSTGLGQDAFLKLLTTQLQNQNPLNPTDNTEFIAQLAQISTVSGIESLNDSFSSLSSSLTSYQTLQAAQLVGHNVLVPSSAGYLPEGGTLDGAVAAGSSGTVQVDIVDASGQVVRTLDLGTQSAGVVNFSWDGKDAGGNTLDAGTYSLQARLIQGDTQTALTTYASSTVQSVQLASDGLTLDLQGLGAFALSDVAQIL
ncbi:flagellar hook assembly protein FlgD [Solimonas marina]|uniref:Basal-body rod modification protein FlgD n=1 Tax=Solimonas marina TaxID=2714601 RepID=A0A969W937_9GAMM|nr:flagellar hook assembly protein FlgD [Solimonas marina]NKF21753.1 flagellar hook assembly protein FlgD [Solimonas marina]